MQHEDYPWLFCASEEASLSAQKGYFKLLRSQLAVFFLVTLLGSITGLIPTCVQKPLSVLIAILVSIGIVLTLVARDRGLDKIWFDGRAVAESVKTAAWRYMMQANPFGAASGQVDNAFIAELTEIETARPAIQSHLGGRANSVKQISDRMRDVRKAEFADRKSEYIDGRIRDQRIWYGNKASWNQRRASAWYALVLILQVASLAWAIFAAAYGPFRLNLGGILMTAAATFTAWTQAKRHEDLTNSYSLASQELLNIEALVDQTQSEDTFQELVDQAEEAISREHTMWCAKRNIRINPRAGRRD